LVIHSSLNGYIEKYFLYKLMLSQAKMGIFTHKGQYAAPTKKDKSVKGSDDFNEFNFI